MENQQRTNSAQEVKRGEISVRDPKDLLSRSQILCALDLTPGGGISRISEDLSIGC